MKIINSIFLFLIATTITAQPDDIVDKNYYTHTNLIELWGNYHINSNTIINDFTNHFYLSQFLDSSLKNRVAANLKYQNRLGLNADAGFYYKCSPDTLFGRPKLSIFIAIKNREHFDMRFSDDFFNLVFYGNRKFAGKTADLNNFNFNYLKYQQFTTGIEWSGLDHSAKIGMGFSVLKGERHLHLNAKKAELYTNEYGEYVDFKSLINVSMSDTSNKGIKAINGYGFSTDLFFEAPYKTKHASGKISIKVSDLGFINWNNKGLVMNKILHTIMKGKKLKTFSNYLTSKRLMLIV